MIRRPRIRCYLVEDRSSHEGSGGGFSVVRFIHLVVENQTPVTLRSVKVPYRLMKGANCLHEDSLSVEQIAPGIQAKSNTFVRESAVFDRIEWSGDVAIDADQDFPKDWITFTPKLPRSTPFGCLALFTIILLVVLGYVLFLRS